MIGYSLCFQGALERSGSPDSNNTSMDRIGVCLVPAIIHSWLGTDVWEMYQLLWAMNMK